jgi:hypothetical protein
MFRVFISAFSLLFILGATSVLEPRAAASNWFEEAKKHLTKNKKAYSDSDPKNASRCVLMNNYGCVMQNKSKNDPTKDDPWENSIGQDWARHAIFSEAVYSVRAVVRDLCSKHKRDLTSAYKILEAYSPWCDTKGSYGVKDGWGRNCPEGKQPPDNFAGPKCKEPAQGERATDAQCAACNCPDRAATKVIAGTGVNSIHADLKLFGADKKPNVKVLIPFLQNHLSNETGGYLVSAALIEKGIALAKLCE